MAKYIAYCSNCGVATQAEDAFDVISKQKWKFEVQRNRGKIVGKIWHCPACKKPRHSQLPQG
jgi:hypothetical protein